MTEVYQNTWLHFKARGDGLELLESNLPIPNHYQRENEQNYSLAWLIDGYFHTTKGIGYLNDIIARIMLTIPITQRIEEAPDCTNRNRHKLASLQNAISLPANLKNKVDTSNRYQDATFWAIKLQAEKLIRAFNGWFDYMILEEWALSHFVPDKEHSTIKAKCRSVWHWYDKQDFKIPEGRKFEMSREQNIKRVHEQRKINSMEKILEASKSLTARKKNGTLSAVAISEQTGLNVKTVRKYIKEMELK